MEIRDFVYVNEAIGVPWLPVDVNGVKRPPGIGRLEVVHVPKGRCSLLIISQLWNNNAILHVSKEPQRSEVK